MSHAASADVPFESGLSPLFLSLSLSLLSLSLSLSADMRFIRHKKVTHTRNKRLVHKRLVRTVPHPLHMHIDIYIYAHIPGIGVCVCVYIYKDVSYRDERQEGVKTR